MTNRVARKLRRCCVSVHRLRLIDCRVRRERAGQELLARRNHVDAKRQCGREVQATHANRVSARVTLSSVEVARTTAIVVRSTKLHWP